MEHAADTDLTVVHLRRQTATVLDDRPLVALGLQAALAEVPDAAGVVVVGQVPRPVEAVSAAAARGQHVVVVLDDVESPGQAAAALDAGARGVALGGGSVAELVHVVRCAVRGRVAVAPAVAERLEELRELRSVFTARELEVLALYATGLPAKSVARRMGVGLETVKTYVKRLRARAEPLGIATTTRLDLVDLARRLDLL
ncbi:response regulator transcription factor [Streptomyces sp. NP160]|uniref:helix-turn-helix transcriptional regulator n=1 Tax=Streptomyces sp. NP160 TaxID=2586637 RepID=UPI00111A5F76|nr:LuxR C-terminal-related transcriptional regulator [Streptomyces sp. NP160]TNM59482.1 response regulator transcription factor [Streptomyces sp. NP160]